MSYWHLKSGILRKATFIPFITGKHITWIIRNRPTPTSLWFVLGRVTMNMAKVTLLRTLLPLSLALKLQSPIAISLIQSYPTTVPISLHGIATQSIAIRKTFQTRTAHCPLSAHHPTGHFYHDRAPRGIF